MKLLVGAGGTGGHLFPALAVVEQLNILTDGNLIPIFIGTKNKIESRIIPNLGFKFFDINISGVSGKLNLKNLALPFKILSSYYKCKKIIKEEQPDAVLCTGAYISYPVGLAASKMQKPLFLMESNVIPGKTIKMLSSKSSLIFTSFEDSFNSFPESCKKKIIVAGNPVRKDILSLPDKYQSRIKFGLQPDKKTILIFGGSLGATSINKSAELLINEFPLSDVQFLWQTGNIYKLDNNVPHNVKQLKFIDDMGSAYASADLVIARAGATTISELTVAGKPSILVPYPFAANNHQEENAKLMKIHGASEMLLDAELNNKLVTTVKELISNTNKLSDMSISAKKMAKPESAEFIARKIIEFIS